MMKYHIQTSGRSLHAQEIQFNDIRTTLQALYALFDNCNSAAHQRLRRSHHHAHRGIGAPCGGDPDDHQQGTGPELLREPVAGQLRVDYLTDLVEEAVYKEFEAISERGGVLGAMDTMYQRGKIQEESLYYEHKKHDGSLPLVGVNTFLPKEHGGDIVTEIELIRSTEGEKGQQIDNVQRYQQLRNDLGSAHPERSAEGARSKDGHGLTFLQATARERRNVFASLMEAVKTHSLGQISHALYDVGGEYRRNM
jgi:methylmalonyl-CoA mutase